jgi:hypothetical protein
MFALRQFKPVGHRHFCRAKMRDSQILDRESLDDGTINGETADRQRSDDQHANRDRARGKCPHRERDRVAMVGPICPQSTRNALHGRMHDHAPSSFREFVTSVEDLRREPR